MARKSQKAREDKDGWQKELKDERGLGRMARGSQKARKDKDRSQERVKRRERIRTDGKKESKGERG